jgi:hypothetical protein
LIRRLAIAFKPGKHFKFQKEIGIHVSIHALAWSAWRRYHMIRAAPAIGAYLFPSASRNPTRNPLVGHKNSLKNFTSYKRALSRKIA